MLIVCELIGFLGVGGTTVDCFNFAEIFTQRLIRKLVRWKVSAKGFETQVEFKSTLMNIQILIRYNNKNITPFYVKKAVKVYGCKLHHIIKIL